MKNVELLRSVVAEQHEEIMQRMQLHTCHRSEEPLVNLNSKMAQVVIGVRRSGKSTLCENVLKEKAATRFAYINFDDDRLIGLEADDLNEILRMLYVEYGTFSTLFMDEVQNVDAWFLFVNRLLRKGMHVLLTGSNAKLLSGELATHLTGRNMQIELYPFSFREFCAMHNVEMRVDTTARDACLRKELLLFLHQGGFPELIDEPRRGAYIDNLVNSIVNRDIQPRYNIRYSAAFNQLLQHVMNTSPLIVNKKQLCQQFHLSVHTLENYLNYLRQAYLVIGVHKYSAKSRLRLQQEKLYVVDVAFMSNRRDAFSGENIGWRLETIVLVELLRRYRPDGCDVYYYQETAGECDFVVCKGCNVLEAIQVCHSLDSEKARKRELKGLALAAYATGCRRLTLITDYDDEANVVLKNGENVFVAVVAAHKWLAFI